MRITFTGKQDPLSPTQERKLATAFARLSKLIERKGEKTSIGGQTFDTRTAARDQALSQARQLTRACSLASSHPRQKEGNQTRSRTGSRGTGDRPSSATSVSTPCSPSNSAAMGSPWPN